MRKVISVILALCMIFCFTACHMASSSGMDNSDTGNSLLQEEEKQETKLYNRELLQLLENAVEVTQPGTAGSSLKAVYATRDIINWLKENKPDVDTIAETVKYFFENCEHADEAKEAFRSIKSVFEAIAESDAAQQLLDMVEINLKELELSDEVMEYAQQLFAEVEKYIDTCK